MSRKQLVLMALVLVFLPGVVIGAGKKEREQPIFNSVNDPGQGDEQKPLTEAQQQQFTHYILQGYSAEGKDDYAEALDRYGKALELNPNSVTAWIRHAYVAAKLGQYEETAENLKQGTSCTPVSVTDYLTLAWFRATSPFPSMRDGAQAVTYAFKALKEQPSADAYDMLAAGYAEMGNYGKAQESLRTAIKIYADSSRVPMLNSHLELYKKRKPWRETWGEDEKQMSKAIDSANN